MSEGEQQQSQEGANSEQQSSINSAGEEPPKDAVSGSGEESNGSRFQHRDSISEVTAGIPSVAYEVPPYKPEGSSSQAPAHSAAGARGKGNLLGNLMGGVERKEKKKRQGPPPMIDMAGKPSSIVRAEGAPDVDGSSNTLFILDLMRQQREKLMRKKKDEMINEMALKMKKDREDAKAKGHTTYSYSYGGFLGVEKLTRGSANVAQPSPKPSRKAVVIDEVAAVPSDAKSRAMFEGP